MKIDQQQEIEHANAVLPKWDRWYKGSIPKEEIEKICFVKSIPFYMIMDERWNVCEDRYKPVTIGRQGNTVYICVGKDGKVYANADSWQMFEGFSSLEEIHGIECLDTSRVTDMFDMFDGCAKLKTLDVSCFDTSNVTDMRSMFCGCKLLTSLDVSHFDTGNVTNMRSMFDGCEALTSLNLSHFDTSKVTNMSWMFDGCKALTSLGVRYFDVSHVEKNEFIFKDCDKLKLENLGTWDTDESKEENTMNERSKKEAVEGLVATTMRVIENNLDLLCSYAEIFLQASGKSSLPKEALIKTTRLELGQFAMYLSASDGTVGEEEAKFISDVMTIDMTPNQIGAYIRENNIYSTQFEQTVPTMFDLFVKTEKMLRLLNNPNASIAHLILPLYEATGETLTYIDCQQSENEKTDYEIYINMLKRHLDTELGTGSAAAGFTKT